MEDALLFQAQAEETCSLWQAGGQAPNVGRGGGHEGPHHRTLLFIFSLMLLLRQHSCSSPMYTPCKLSEFGTQEWVSGRARHGGSQVAGLRVIPDCGFEGWGNGNWECDGW